MSRFAASGPVLIVRSIALACIGFLANPVDGAGRRDRAAVPVAAAAADFDGDGALDVAGAYSTTHGGSVAVLLSKSSETRARRVGLGDRILGEPLVELLDYAPDVLVAG